MLRPSLICVVHALGRPNFGNLFPGRDTRYHLTLKRVSANAFRPVCRSSTTTLNDLSPVDAPSISTRRWRGSQSRAPRYE